MLVTPVLSVSAEETGKGVGVVPGTKAGSEKNGTSSDISGEQELELSDLDPASLNIPRVGEIEPEGSGDRYVQTHLKPTKVTIREFGTAIGVEYLFI